MMKKPSRCCSCGSYSHCILITVGNKVAFCDYCVAPFVVALNAGGIRTLASCCGHGKIDMSIIVEKDYNEYEIIIKKR